MTKSLLANDEVIAIDQDLLGLSAKRLSKKDGVEIWFKDLKNGSRAIGIFNRAPMKATATLRWGDVGLKGKQSLREV